MAEYIYTELDADRLKKHIEKQEKLPIEFQNSFCESIKIDAFSEILECIKEGKDVGGYIKQFIYDASLD